MLLSFDASIEYVNSETKIDKLIQFSIQEEQKGDDDNKVLFLKLCLVFLVTRFQVYIESVLKEFEYRLQNSNKPNQSLHTHLRLNIIKLHAERKAILSELKDPTSFTANKLNSIKSIVNELNVFCNDAGIIQSELKIETKFPMGKQGLNELKSLFRQIEGKDIFENATFDINKLNEILNRRHNIIHEDANDQLTPFVLNTYKIFIRSVVEYIDTYLNANISV